MKILLSGDLSDVMKKQPTNIVAEFIEAIDKLQDMSKPQILLLDTVVELSSPDDKEKLYAYYVSGKNYTIFAFTPKNEMVLLDYIQVRNKGLVSLTYPDMST